MKSLKLPLDETRVSKLVVHDPSDISPRHDPEAPSCCGSGEAQGSACDRRLGDRNAAGVSWLHAIVWNKQRINLLWRFWRIAAKFCLESRLENSLRKTCFSVCCLFKSRRFITESFGTIRPPVRVRFSGSLAGGIFCSIGKDSKSQSRKGRLNRSEPKVLCDRRDGCLRLLPA